MAPSYHAHSETAKARKCALSARRAWNWPPTVAIERKGTLSARLTPAKAERGNFAWSASWRYRLAPLIRPLIGLPLMLDLNPESCSGTDNAPSKADRIIKQRCRAYYFRVSQGRTLYSSGTG